MHKGGDSVGILPPPHANVGNLQGAFLVVLKREGFDRMVRAELTIANAQGIHLGPANKIASLADRFNSKIHFKTEYMDVNAKSIINLVSGTFHQGDKVLCVCDGPDEKEALKAMQELLSGDLEEKNK